LFRDGDGLGACNYHSRNQGWWHKVQNIMARAAADTSTLHHLDDRARAAQQLRTSRDNDAMA
jgi:hypothetical protein